MKNKTTKKENRTANLEYLRKESQKAMEQFIKSRRSLGSIFNSIDLRSITAISNSAQNAINAVAASMEHAKKTIEIIKNEQNNKTLFIAPPLSRESRMEIILNKIYDKLDKNLGGDKMNKEIKDKVAYCKFCGAIVMRVEELSYFTKGTIKCAKCEKMLRIPEGLDFK